MTRHQPLEHYDLPRIVPRPLSQAYDWAKLLGWDLLPDWIAATLTDFRARMPVTQRIVAGYTPGRVEADMRRIGRDLRRDGRNGWRATEARQKVADPSTLPWDFHERLAPLAGRPADELREAVEAVGREIAALPPTNPQWEHAFGTAACLIGIYFATANPASRSDAGAWKFVLAMFDSVGLPNGGLRRNPRRLRNSLRPLLAMMQPE